MPFWSSQTLKVKIPAEQLVVPYVEARVVHSAYEMGVGSEAFVTSNSSDKTQIAADIVKAIPTWLSARPVLKRRLASGSGV